MKVYETVGPKKKKSQGKCSRTVPKLFEPALAVVYVRQANVARGRQGHQCNIGGAAGSTLSSPNCTPLS
eukprot:4064531-Amphidinium_carterae.1